MKLSDIQHYAEVAAPVAKQSANVGAVTIAGGSLFGYLPPIAAGLSIIWISLQIFEWVENRLKKGKE